MIVYNKIDVVWRSVDGLLLQSHADVPGKASMGHAHASTASNEFEGSARQQGSRRGDTGCSAAMYVEDSLTRLSALTSLKKHIPNKQMSVAKYEEATCYSNITLPLSRVGK